MSDLNTNDSIKLGNATTVGALRDLLHSFRDDTPTFCGGARPVVVRMEWDSVSQQTWLALSGLGNGDEDNDTDYEEDDEEDEQ